MKMKNALIRLLGGSAYAVIVITATLLSEISFFLLYATIMVLCLVEFYRLTGKTGAKAFRFGGVITALIIYCIAACYFIELFQDNLHVIPIIAIFLLLSTTIWSKSSRPFNDIGITVLGVVYISLPFIFLQAMAFFPGPGFLPQILMTYIALVWAFDTFAYITGSLLGKHKLLERVSPKKTWEGIAGGTIGAVGIAFFVPLLINQTQLMDRINIALLVSLTGTLGDLFKSVLKRNAGEKDSGKIIPGHGGMLDRFDSILFSVPFVYAYLQF